MNSAEHPLNILVHQLSFGEKLIHTAVNHLKDFTHCSTLLMCLSKLVHPFKCREHFNHHQLESHLYRFINYQTVTEDLTGFTHCGWRWKWRQGSWLVPRLPWQDTHNSLCVKLVFPTDVLSISLPWDLWWKSIAWLGPVRKQFHAKLKMEVERRKATKWDPARVENMWGRSLRQLTKPKVKKAACILQGVGCRVEGGHQRVVVKKMAASYAYWHGQ